jgi:drug/metabolite transporter (DMT)-like permease
LSIRKPVESVVALVVFASAYALIRIALTELPPLTVAALRFILASSLLVPVALVHYHGTESKFASRDLPMLLGLSVAQIFLPNFLQNIGLEYTTASVSSVLQSTTPVFTLLLSFAFLKENIGVREFVGVTVAMLGVILLSTGGNVGSLAGSVFVGNLLQIGVAASYAVSGIIGKFLLKAYQPMFVVMLTFVLGGLLLTLFAVVFERNLWPATISNEVIVALLLLSFMYCVGLVCWYDVLQGTGVFRLYALLFTMPVLAVLISVVVLNENFTIPDIVFSGLTLLGVGITQLSRPTSRFSVSRRKQSTFSARLGF